MMGFALAAASTAGCADYLNRYDTVTLAAGDSQKHNMLLHTDDPFNPNSEITAIPTDGQRAANAVRLYRSGPGGPAVAAPETVINIGKQGD